VPAPAFPAASPLPARPLRLLALTLALLAGVALPTPTHLDAQAPALAEVHAGDDWLDAVRAARTAVRAVMDSAGVPGASVAVGVGDGIVWSEGFGWADLEQRVPVTPLTRFRVGSVSKTMTASGLGLLVERGRVDLDEPVQRYVPDFPEKRWPVTTRQLGGHTAGIRHYRGNEMLSAKSFPTVASGLTIFAEDTLLFEPETGYAYSSYGWNLLSAVMEGASGRPFLAFMRDEVFEPLGLRNTVAEHMDSIIPWRTRYYEQGEDGRLVHAPYVDNSYKWAGGGFLSTPEDLVRFGRAHLRPGFLRAATLAELQEPQTLRNGESTGYGIGWRRYPQDDGDQALGHSGGSVGGTTLLLLVPEHDLVVAGVVNISGPAGRIVEEVAEIFEARLEGGR
jgi:CubicO group peptidase (beta-lactamase class C family)